MRVMVHRLTVSPLRWLRGERGAWARPRGPGLELERAFSSRRRLAETETELEAIGARVGAHLAGHYLGCRRDEDGTVTFPHCILLTGHPGAGKTVFARGLIRELCDPSSAESIPSPTFCLDFGYPVDAQRHPALASVFEHGLHHLDLYRMCGATRSDLQSLNFFESTRKAIVLVEWPDRLGHAGVSLPGALEVDIQLQDQMEDSCNREDEPEGGELTLEMMEALISQPRSVELKENSGSTLWSDFVL
eukprot:g357.t1